MSKSQFRFLVLIQIAFTFATIAVTFIPNLYSPALELAYMSEPQNWLTAKLWLALAISIPLILLIFIGIFGLYFFKPWGRSLSAYTTLATAILIPFFGPTLKSAIESSLNYVSTLLWGAILALAYYSPLNALFVKVPRNVL
jgi:hypothetical protein